MTGERMPSDLHIAIVDDDKSRAALLEDGLREAGVTRVSVVPGRAGLVRRLADLSPDVVIIGLENPSRDVLEEMFQVSRAVARPVAMFVDRSDGAMIEAAIDAGVAAYVVDGLRRERVKPIVDMAISRYNAFARLRGELESARAELAERKVIDRAKGILMKRRGLSEEEAYALLRKTAMNQSRKVVEIAESLVTAAGLLEEPR